MRRLVLADGDAEDVVAGAQALGVLADVAGVVAEPLLEPSHHPARPAVRLAADVDAREALLAVQHVAAVGAEPGPLQAPAGVRDGRLVGEHPDDAAAWVGERVG